MQSSSLATRVVLCGLAAVVVSPCAGGVSGYPSASIHVVPQGADAAIAATRTGRPSLDPSLTVTAADPPRPLPDGEAKARPLAGRLHAPAAGTGDVLLRELSWTLDRERGELRAAIAVALRPGAAAIKVAVDGERLSHPLAVRFVGTEEDMARVRDAPELLGPGIQTLAWSSTMSGAQLVVELARRADLPLGDEERLRVAEIAEVFAPAEGAKVAPDHSPRSKTASACFRDVACESAFDEASRGIVLLEVVTGAGVYVCTGSLLRTADDGRERVVVLTAGHCLADATGVTVYFGYRSQSCNGPSPAQLALQRMTKRAPFLFDIDQDFGLVDLPGPAPPGVTLLGWSAAPIALGDSLVALHHARGGTQGVFRARVAALSRSFITPEGRIREMPLYEGTDPDVGMNTGASGSPFINDAGQVRGLVTATTGPLQQCTDGQGYRTQIAGPAFAKVYPAIADYLNGVAPPPPAAVEEGDLRSVGGLSYAVLAGDQIRVIVDRIENTSATAPTGTLRASACAAEVIEAASCLPLWQVVRDALPPGGSYEPLVITETYSPPPAGTYYIRFVLEELESVGPRRFLLAHSTRAETWVPPPPRRVCVKYKKGVCRKWKTL